jgi:hypothetical protein
MPMQILSAVTYMAQEHEAAMPGVVDGVVVLDESNTSETVFDTYRTFWKGSEALVRTISITLASKHCCTGTFGAIG